MSDPRIPTETETTNPTRSPNDPLISLKQGDAGGLPREFAASLVVTTVEQTGISATQPLAPADDAAMWESQLQQSKTREKTLVQKFADPTGLSITQQETDPISGVPVQITKTIVPSIGGVFEVALSSGGSGYTSPPTVTGLTPYQGLPAAYGTPVLSGGVVQSVPIIDPGSGFAQNDVLTFTGGGGTGAAGTGTIPSYPSTSSGVSVVDVVSGGSLYTGATIATVSPPDLGGRIAILGVTISGGVITALPVIDPGYGYTTMPTVTITDSGGGSGAGTMVLLLVDTWYDYTPLDKWKSIQFASRCPATQAQLNLLAVDIGGSTQFPWPPTLTAATIYRADGTHTETASGTFTQVTIGGGYQFSGAAVPKLNDGIRSPVDSVLHRSYWRGAPTITDTITKIQLVQGSIVVQGGTFSTFTTYSVSSIASGTSTDTQTSALHQVVSIPPCLSNGVGLNFVGGSQAQGTLVLGTSTPVVFNSGDVVTADIRVTQLNFGIYKLEVLKVTYP